MSGAVQNTDAGYRYKRLEFLPHKRKCAVIRPYRHKRLPDGQAHAKRPVHRTVGFYENAVCSRINYRIPVFQASPGQACLCLRQPDPAATVFVFQKYFVGYGSGSARTVSSQRFSAFAKSQIDKSLGVAVVYRDSEAICCFCSVLLCANQTITIAVTMVCYRRFSVTQSSDFL